MVMITCPAPPRRTAGHVEAGGGRGGGRGGPGGGSAAVTQPPWAGSGAAALCGASPGIRDTGYAIRDTRRGIRDTRYEIRDTRYEIRDTGYEIRVAVWRIAGARNRHWARAPRIPGVKRASYPASRIPYPVSRVPRIPYLVSRVSYPRRETLRVGCLVKGSRRARAVAVPIGPGPGAGNHPLIQCKAWAGDVYPGARDPGPEAAASPRTRWPPRRGRGRGRAFRFRSSSTRRSEWPPRPRPSGFAGPPGRA